MKIILTVLLLFSLTTVFATQSSATSEIKLKNSKESIFVVIVGLSKNTITYIDPSGKNVDVSNDDIDYIKNVDKNDTKFKKTVILTNYKYYSGSILYQDREKISLQIGDDLKSIKNEDIVDIVSENDFKEEASRSRWKAVGLSSLFPGTGQFYSNRYTVGMIYGLSFIGSSSFTAYFYVDAQKKWKDYKISNYRNMNTYKKYKQDMYMFYGGASLSGAIYLWNIIDSCIFFKYKYEVLNVPDSTKKIDVSLNQINSSEYSFAINYHF